jgi:hypothetical protein
MKALTDRPEIAEWTLQSNVAEDILRMFVSAIEGEALKLTNENIEGLSALCDEFQFESFSHRLESFKNTPDYRLSLLEQRFARLDGNFSLLRSSVDTVTAPALARLQSDVTRLNDRIDLLQARAAAI